MARRGLPSAGRLGATRRGGERAEMVSVFADTGISGANDGIWWNRVVGG